MAEATHLLGLPRKHKPKDIKPQGAGSGLDADKVDGLHASEIGGGGPHATTHETGGTDKVYFADLERDETDETLHDAFTGAPHISQADKNKIHDRLHALSSSLDHSGEITDAQHGIKTTIPYAHHVWQQRLVLVKMIGYASKSGEGWAAISNSDVVFDPNWLTGTVKGRLCVIARVSGGTGYARLYQQFQNLYMASTQINVTNTNYQILRSPEFTDWYNGLESYMLALWGPAGGSIEVASAFLEVWIS